MKEVTVNVTYISGNQLLCVINTRHADLSLTDKWVVIGVGGDEESLWKGSKGVIRSVLCSSWLTVVLFVTYDLRLFVGHNLVENVVAPLCRQLKRYSGFFQQIYKKQTEEL